MLENGYAWAQSTYSKNGYNVAQGVKDTHALSKRFNGLVGKPTDVFITGYSMGGHITAVSAEQFSRSYTAAMPMCGVVGDYELFDYFLDFNVAAQQIALGTSSFPVADDYLTATVPEVKAALGPFFPFVLNADGAAFAQLVELRSGGDRPYFDDAFRFWNSTATDPNGNFLFDLGTGNGALPGRPGVAADNIGVEYQTDLDPALSASEIALNEGIARVQADRSARSSNGLSNVPKVSGDIQIPTLTLHNVGDLFVPFHNEVVYGAEAASSGTSDLLVQRAILGAIHCDFAASEVIAGLSDLITWVDGGPRPAGDDVLDTASVADPQFGCQFTLEPKFAGLSATGTPSLAFCP
jgi:pimeloyl-ACP methyl ester carboxylesterase